jgi:uncharacterized integral membrane protein
MSDDETPAKPTPGPQRKDHVYGKPPGAGDWKRIARLTGLGVLVVYAVLFFLMNRETVTISLVVATVKIPLIWVLLGTFLLGGLAAYLASFLRRRLGSREDTGR